MRRMMHAAVVFLAFSSLVNAQNNSSPYNMGDQSLLIRADEANSSQPMSGQDAPSLQFQPQVIQPASMQAGCNRPYSQLAVSMACSDCCPNIWGNYASERAALAAKICEHIDGRCGCLTGRHSLHNQACGPCGSTCGELGVIGKKGCISPRNRYREPFSTLHNEPSVNCGSSCLSKHLYKYGSACTDPSCNGCESSQGQAGQWSPYPASAARAPDTTRLANPPKDRLAVPFADNLRANAAYNRGSETVR